MGFAAINFASTQCLVDGVCTSLVLNSTKGG